MSDDTWEERVTLLLAKSGCLSPKAAQRAVVRLTADRDAACAEADRLRAERDEARKHVREHHLEACESCAVMESDLIAARAEADRLREASAARAPDGTGGTMADRGGAD